MTPDGRRARRLGTPKPTSVIPGDGGAPRSVAGREVDAVREGMEPAAELFERVALDETFVEFLTLPAYELLD